MVRVVANDRSGLLRDITTILANEKVNVLGVASRSDTKQQLATIVGCTGVRPKFARIYNVD